MRQQVQFLNFLKELLFNHFLKSRLLIPLILTILGQFLADLLLAFIHEKNIFSEISFQFWKKTIVLKSLFLRS